jgi:O-methyltransferase
MRSQRIRLRLLSLLGIRDESAFFPLSDGGSVAAIEGSLAELLSAQVIGDYFEFGLYRGYSFWSAQRAAKGIGHSSMRFFGFDSFEGLPEVEGNDRKAGIFVSGDYRCSRPELERLLSEHGFDWDCAVLVDGFFDQSLTPEIKQRHAMSSAALVMIDCDLYQSTVPVLRFIADLIQEGTILLFDDWYCFAEADDRGEPRAFREFLAGHPDWTADRRQRFSRYGQAFVMRRCVEGLSEHG